MRKIISLTVVLILVVFAIPAHADPKPKDVNATVVNEPTVHVGSMPEGCCGNTGIASTLYQFAGFSTDTTPGNASGGLGGMHAMCRDDFGNTARMCTTKEVLLSSNIPDSYTAGENGWVQPIIVAALFNSSTNYPQYIDFSGAIVEGAFTPTSAFSCQQWQTSAGFGLWFHPPSGIHRETCQNRRRVSCCTPAN
jgi:hypothetical protein